MAESRISTLRALWAPKLVKSAFAIVALVAGYDSFSSQFGFPKLGAVVGMSGSLLPWWGWLLVLQAIFVYALFEYVRRAQLPGAYDDSALRAEIADVNVFAEAVAEALSKETAGKIEKLKGLVDFAIEQFGERLDKLEKGAKATLKSDEMTAHRIDAVVAAIDRVKAYGEGLGVSIRDLVEGQAEALREQRDFQARMEAWVGQLREDMDRRFEWIDQGFSAILDRERLLALADTITAEGDELSGPTQGEPMGDRDEWLAKFGRWQRNVETWSRIGAVYRDGVVERVFDTPQSEYRGKWKATDDLFPDSVAVHDYKTFRIISRNFHAEQEHVDNCVRMAAFARPSMKGRSPTSRDEQQMPRPPKLEL